MTSSVATSRKPLVLLLGQSGAGISSCVRALQDLGFFVTDNLPLALVSDFVRDLEKKLASLSATTQSGGASARGSSESSPTGASFSTGFAFGIHNYVLPSRAELKDVMQQLGSEYAVDPVFLCASTEVLEQRFSVTRRPHPQLYASASLRQCIEQEKQLLLAVQQECAYVLDSSRLTPHILSHHMQSRYLTGQRQQKLLLLITSFGFKKTTAVPGDVVFDVRFLKNPYFKAELRDHSGLRAEVAEYVRSDERYTELMAHIRGFLDFTLPFYGAEGRSYLRLSIGCTGGQHRSVTVAEDLGRIFSCQKSYPGLCVHLAHSALGPAAS